LKNYDKMESIRARIDRDHADRVRARAAKQRRKLNEQIAFELLEYERGMK